HERFAGYRFLPDRVGARDMRAQYAIAAVTEVEMEGHVVRVEALRGIEHQCAEWLLPDERVQNVEASFLEFLLDVHPVSPWPGIVAQAGGGSVRHWIPAGAGMTVAQIKRADQIRPLSLP